MNLWNRLKLKNSLYEQAMEILNIILANTYTLISLKKRFRILKEYLEKEIFGGDIKLELSVEDQTWLNSLPRSLLTPPDQKTFSATMEQLGKLIGDIEPLVVYVAFDMPGDELASLTQYIRKMLNSPLYLLDVKKDPNLIAGAAFVYKGVYKDYSLKSKIEQNKEKILLEFKRSLE